MKRIGYLWSVRRVSTFVALYGRVASCWEYRRGVSRLLTVLPVGKVSFSTLVSDLLRKGNEMAKKPEVGQVDATSGYGVASAGTWNSLFPKLAALMIDMCWDDGTLRSGCRLFIQTESTRWVGVLKEPNLGVQLSVSVETPDDILPAIEAVLSTPRPPWVRDPWAKNQPGKKRR